MSEREFEIAIVGGGPAGLRAAEVAAERGARVTLFDGKRAVGRKFLIAGRSGLNLTNSEEFDSFLDKYSGSSLRSETWNSILGQFDNRALREWAKGLGIETFVANNGRIMPTPIGGKMRATPLLRNWIARLRELGVQFNTEHRFTGFGESGELLFDAAGQTLRHSCDRAILALGGGSWPKTGSDGAWTSIFEERGIRIAPLQASNCGWETTWPSAILEGAEGLPLKNLKVTTGDQSQRGELVLTRYGLEGGPLYRLGPILRAHSEPSIKIDFKPDQSREDLLVKLGNVKRNFVREAKRRLHLDPATCALLKFLPARGPWKRPDQLVDEIKGCRIDLLRPRPLAEAISTAGGIHWEELDENLQLKKLPNVFVAGEMIDWDAPTGGYLLQACFATGTCAGRAASQTAP